MKLNSIQNRLHLGASMVMLAFFCVAGFAVQGVYSDHLRSSHYARLQSAIYLLIAATELNPQGQLELPARLAEPRFSVPDSGLYALIDNVDQNERWQSPSTAFNIKSPTLTTGEWQNQDIQLHGRGFLQTAYQVRWAIGSKSQILRFVVLEDGQFFTTQLQQFQRALWGWLVAAALCLLLAQAALLRWGLSPLRRLESELAAIEQGEQTQVNGEYPRELAPLTQRLNRLVEQERARQQRYREGLADLAHSLKTPLAIMRADACDDAGDESAYAARVAEQVDRMDHIVQHQLSRAALRGGVELAAPILLQPIAQRLLATMQKVYAARELQFTLVCADDVAWPLDEGDAFEVFGNLLDNAGKWAQHCVEMKLTVSESSLQVTIADDGPGFDGQPERALQRGIRLDERVAGQGIGLSVAADIIHAYGGEINISRSALGGAEINVIIKV